MTKKSDLSREEVQAQDASALPDKEAMSLLDVNADLDLSLDIAAPIDAAVAANANAALPIDAAVSANVLSFDSVISQSLDGVANATAIQDATIDQAEG
jgi:hypothetical protein